MNLNIYIDSDLQGYWYPWYPGTPSGGSEHHMTLLAEELGKQGHTVMVRNNCGTKNAGQYGHVKYVHYEDCVSPTSSDKIDVYCSQRLPRLLKERIAPVQVLLCHDIPNSSHFPTQEELRNGALDNTDIVMALNNHHRQLYIDYGVPADKIKICPVLLDPSFFVHPEVERIPGRCSYHSCMDRGLEGLVNRYWPEIKRRAPHATLQICWNIPIKRDWFKYADGDEALGILPQKVLKHDELGIELSKAELHTYPCTFGAEISPVATLASQAAGCIPIVVIQGGMVDTVTDFGHRTEPDTFVTAVVNALNDKTWQGNQRKDMSRVILERYDKESSARTWINIIYDVIRRKRMFSGIYDLSARDINRDWSLSKVKTAHFDMAEQPVVAHQNPWELAQMIELYVQKKPLTVLELGPCQGGVLYHWLKNAVAGASIAAVDWVDGVMGGGTPDPKLWKTWVPKNVEFKFFQGDTRDPEIIAAVTKHMPQIDWLFIDATHEYDSCMADFVNYGPLVSKGGIVLFHDIRPRGNGSNRVFEELRACGYKTQELAADPNATEAGVGVVYL